MRLFITGGAGFIGSNFVRYWLAGHPHDEVVNFDALTYAGDPTSLADVERDFAPRYRFVKGDIADAAAVRDALRSSGADAIVNFAAESHNSRGVLDPYSFVRTNVLGTNVLLEAARALGVARFHHISTCEVYGDLPLDAGTAFREDDPYRPRTPYSSSKAAADLLVRAYHESFGLNCTITNCANNYGPFQYPEKVIPLFTTNAIEGRPLPIYRQSANRREWIHVGDHCRGIEAVLRSGEPGATYNVGTGDERSIEQIADAILALLGKDGELKHYVQDRPGHDRRYLLDHRKIERDLGWRPVVSFDDGLRETIAWYVEHEAWWRPKKERLRRELDEFAWAAR